MTGLIGGSLDADGEVGGRRTGRCLEVLSLSCLEVWDRVAGMGYWVPARSGIFAGRYQGSDSE